MFSVSASPFNSRRRQLYGGWAAQIPQATLDGTDDDIVAYYTANPLNYYLDSKWANMALKYSPFPDDARKARKIKRALKGQLATMRQNDAFRTGYAAALADRKTPALRPRLQGTSRQLTWQQFNALPTGRLTDNQKIWLSLASNGPYSSTPSVDPVYDFPNLPLQRLVAGPLGSEPVLRRYSGPDWAADQIGRWGGNDAELLPDIPVPRGVVRPAGN